MRCVLQQETAFGEALADEAEVMLLEVAQAAVHHLGGLGRGAARKVASFHESGSQSPRGRVQRDTGPGDPSPHDDDVEALACKPGQSDVTVENGRWSFHQGTVATACHKPAARQRRLTAPRQRRAVAPHGPRAGQLAVERKISRSRGDLPVKSETLTAEDLKNNWHGHRAQPGGLERCQLLTVSLRSFIIEIPVGRPPGVRQERRCRRPISCSSISSRKVAVDGRRRRK